MPIHNLEYYSLMPFIILAIGIIVSISIEMFYSKSKYLMPYVSLAIYLLVAINSVLNIHNHFVVFGGMLETGGKAAFLNILFNLGAAVVTLSSINYLEKYGTYFGEFHLLVQLSVLGMMVMAGSKDLFMVFMGLELMSISFYVLVGMNRKRITANESSMKYFLLGSFATGFIVYGIALIYGAATTTNIEVILSNFSNLSANVLFVLGMFLFIIGFSFKIAAFPFHSWVPDVYQGSSTTVTGLMSSVGKTAAFSVIFIMLTTIFAGVSPNIFRTYFSVIAAFSMLFGSIVAISQKNIKRMLAYSSISHAGYISIGLASGNNDALAGMLFYLFAYSFMNLGAFGVISILEDEKEGNLELNDYIGLSKSHPYLAGLLSLFLIALTGIPPLAGFFGKYYVFMSAVESDLVWLALVGVLSSIISAYFYLRPIVLMYFRESDEPINVEVNLPGMLAVLFSATVILLYGIFPNFLLDLIKSTINF
jgi:NADH-quinone oxidoreductase subunit N